MMESVPPATRTNSATERKRIGGLDGMRGLAFLLVFVVHLRVPAALAQYPGVEKLKEAGWIGVSLFFVISGYLITRLCLEEGNDFSLSRFYARRSLRLFPLYFVTVIAVLLAWRVPLLREIRVAAAPEWTVWLLTFTTNFKLNAGTIATLGASVVFWTLAVEEQFYVVWGTVLRYARRRAALLICVAILLWSLYSRMTVADEPHFMFYRTQTAISFGSLMIGCLVALVGTRGLRISRGMTSFLAAALLVTFLLIAKFEWPFPSKTSAASLLITSVDIVAVSLLLLALCGSGPVTSFLDWRVMRAIGNLSYAAYVTHLAWLWIYYAAMDGYLKSQRLNIPPLLLVLLDGAMVLGITLLFASGWYRLEKPFRTWRHWLRKPVHEHPSLSPIPAPVSAVLIP